MQSEASLLHPNVIPIYNWGRSEAGAYYIAMGHVPGGLLKDRILPRARVCRKPSLRNSSPRTQGDQYSGTAMTVSTKAKE